MIVLRRYAHPAFLLALALGFGTLAQAQEVNVEWSQFRGPEGTGVTVQTGLPIVWGSRSSNIEWKTAIPGEGNFSPVLHGDRIFLTTAYEGSVGGLSRKLFDSSVCVLLAILCLTLAIRFLRGRQARGLEPGRGLFVARLDRLVVFAGFSAFLGCAVTVALGPDAVNHVLSRIHDMVMLPGIRTAVNKLDMKGHHVRWRIGEYRDIWLITSGVFTLGCAMSVAWFRPRSVWRLAGVGAVLVAFVLFLRVGLPFYHKVPLDHMNPHSFGRKLYFAFPALLISCWYVAAFVGARLFRRDAEMSPAASTKSFPAFAGLLTIVIAILCWFPHNVLQARFGLVRAAICVDLESGKLLWDKRLFVATAERKHWVNSYATPTPSVDKDFVYTAFGSALVCLDHDGNVVWEKHDPTYSEQTRYGSSSSPVLVNDVVIQLKGHETGSSRPSSLEAFDRKTGKLLWQIDPECDDSYVTPLVVKTSGGAQLIVASFQRVTSYDALNGNELWRQENRIEQHAASMTRAGNYLCVGGGTAGPKELIVMRLEGDGAESNVEVLWKKNTSTPGVASPVVYDGRLYTLTEMGILSCYDVRDGKRHWRTRLRRVEGRNGYFPSLTAGDGKVYALSSGLRMTVLKASDELEVLSENQLEGECFATPGFAPGRILVRTSESLFCIGKETQAQAAKSTDETPDRQAGAETQ